MNNASSGTHDLEGLWRSFYRYPSSGRENDALWGRHLVGATVDGNNLHIESVPGSKSQVTIELTFAADGTAEGTWREATNPDGYYKGVVYEGTITLKLSDDRRRLNGTWHGKGKGGEVNSDIWELTRDGIDEANSEANK